MPRTTGAAKRHVPEQLKDAVSQSLRRGDITAREATSIIGRRSSRKSGAAGDLLELDDHATPRATHAQSKKSSTAKKRTAPTASESADTTIATQPVDPRSVRAKQRAMRSGQLSPSSTGSSAKAKQRRAPHCRNCGLPMKDHDDQCNRHQIELEAHARADRIVERTHLEAQAAKQRIDDQRRTQHTSDEDAIVLHSGSFERKEDAMEEDDAHDVLGGDLEPMLRGEIGFAGEEDVTSPAHLAHKGDTAFITSSTETPDGRSRMSFASSPAVSKRTAEPSGMTEPVYQMPSRDGSVEITGLAHQNSTQPSSPPHAYKILSTQSSTTQHGDGRHVLEPDGIRDDDEARSESEPESQGNRASHKIDEQHGNGAGDGESVVGEDEGEALTEVAMRKLARELSRGRVLSVKEARDLRRSLDKYEGADKPGVDRFLVASEMLKSSYQVKTYTHRLEGGVKATPNGAVQLPLSCGKRKTRNSTHAERKKHRHERFNTFALKGDALAAAEDDEIWILGFAVPKTGAGELREWTSPAVRTDAPRLSENIRKMIFDHLNPHREQAVREREAQEQAWQKQLNDMKAEAHAAERRNRVLQEQIESMHRDKLRLETSEEDRALRRQERKDARRAAKVAGGRDNGGRGGGRGGGDSGRVAGGAHRS